MNFFVPGVPRPQGSKKGFINKKTGGVILTESGGQAHKDWRAVVALAGTEKMAGQQPLEGPLTVELRFYLPRPKSHPKNQITWPITRPDLDKLARSVLDALTHVCWVDDAQIVELYLNKFWSIDTPVGVDVDVWPTPHTADESVVVFA